MLYPFQMLAILTPIRTILATLSEIEAAPQQQRILPTRKFSFYPELCTLFCMMFCRRRYLVSLLVTCQKYSSFPFLIIIKIGWHLILSSSSLFVMLSVHGIATRFPQIHIPKALIRFSMAFKIVQISASFKREENRVDVTVQYSFFNFRSEGTLYDI